MWPSLRSRAARACPLALALLPLLLVSGCDGEARADAPSAQAALRHEGAEVVVPERSPLRARIVVAEVQRRAVEQPITAPGSIEALPDHLARITPPVSGRIDRLHRALGDAVR